MSHSHTHAPGEEHSHSHSQPAPTPQMAPPPDPALQALIEQDFHPIPIALGAPDNSQALCENHSLEKCTDCDVDFVNLNRLAKLLVANPNLMCPPPANVVSQKLTQVITTTKEEGNASICCLLTVSCINLILFLQAFYRMGLHSQAISRYTMAASIAIQRPPWEAQQFMREELSTVLSNRSAAYCESGDYIGALVDAESVIQMRRNWSKGHFRRAKALLGLGNLDEAMDAVRFGLSFEPNNTVGSTLLLWFVFCTEAVWPLGT